MIKVAVPRFDALMNPLMQALKELGGSGTIREIDDRVIASLGLTEAQWEVLHKPEQGGRQTGVEYQLAWTKSYLKKYGVLENSSRGVWALTPRGRELGSVDPKEVRRTALAQRKQHARPVEEGSAEEEAEAESSWRDELLDVLLDMQPAAFERLVQRMLRESGFIQVEVTGRSGDGGIDGKGIMRLGGLMSFHVIFQCKRYRESVAAGLVRDFRGAMVGRADKGLLITTGNFTKDAVREATRDGAPAIDLIDGEQLLDKLKELRLGVETRRVVVEQVTIDRHWFESI